jgi:uncharacterized membrane protein
MWKSRSKRKPTDWLRRAASELSKIPVLGPLLMVLVSIVVALAAAVIWLVLVVKAFQGFMFRLPVLGEFAVHYAMIP